jgi:aspartyl-tRNA(Asn)/glutamyl-tRNA(Gln) amidotransferase subunit B
MGSIKSHLNERALHISDFPVAPATIARLISLVEQGVLSNSAASGEVFRSLLARPDADPEELAREKNLIQESDQDALMELVKQALASYPEKVEEYKAGKKGLLGMFMGEVMKLSKGKADPKVASKLVKQELEK